MANADFIDSTNPCYYLGLSPQNRAGLAEEMFAEIYEHNEGLDALLLAINDRAESLKDHDPTLQQLIKVALGWSNGTGHVGQIYRLQACLAAIKSAAVEA